MTKWVPIIILAFNFLAFAQPNQTSSEACAQFLGSDDPIAETLSHLPFENETALYQSVHFDSIDNEFLYLKKKGRFWRSEHIMVPSTFTNQGDPRSPIHLLGSNLAALFGFRIFTTDKGETILRTPNAIRLERLIRAANRNLVAKGLEPIRYLPKRAGFLTSRQIITLAAAAEDEFALLFPFSDDSPLYSTHEVSFHLGAIIMPSEILIRAQKINQLTIQFIKILEDHRASLGEAVDRITNQLLLERSFELDSGTANSTGTLAVQRAYYGMGRFTQLLMNEQAFRIVDSAIETLARPGHSPSMAVALRLIKMLDIHAVLDKRIKEEDVNQFFAIEIPDKGFGQKIVLTEAEKAKVTMLLKKFIADHIPDDSGWEMSTAKEFRTRWIMSLDDRILDLTRALREISPLD